MNICYDLPTFIEWTYPVISVIEVYMNFKNFIDNFIRTIDF